jgi:hypothetical protein
LGQDSWAQVVERLGDRWGRGIRYGEPPSEPDLSATGEQTRAQFFASVLSWGHELDDAERNEQAFEEFQEQIRDLEARYGRVPQAAVGSEEEEDAMGRLAEDRQFAEAFRNSAEAARIRIEQLLADLVLQVEGWE